MRKMLFICNQNKHRSKTAEHIFKHKFETKSAGLYNQKPVTAKEISWADVVMVMEERQRTEIAKRFPQLYLQKRILSLEIPEVYDYDDPKLIKALENKLRENNLRLR